MSIIIKTRKTVTSNSHIRRCNGKLGREITDLMALSKGELPGSYLNKKDSFYASPSGKSFYSDDPPKTIFIVGNFYPENEFQEKLAFIKSAGNCLMEVNRELEALRSAWNGEEIFEI